MRTQQTLEREDDNIEREAERFVELEDDIRDARERVEESEDADVEFDIRPSTLLSRTKRVVTSDVQKARVVSAERRGKSNVRLRFEYDGEIVEKRLPFPDNPTDGTEPLVRLCRRDGVPVTKVADLEYVPVIETCSEVKILLPPSREESRVNLQVTDGTALEFDLETWESRWKRWTRRVQQLFLFTPLISGKPGAMKVEDEQSIVGFLALGCLSLLVFIAGAATGTSVGAGLAFVLAVGMLVGGMWAVMAAEAGEDFETV